MSGTPSTPRGFLRWSAVGLMAGVAGLKEERYECGLERHGADAAFQSTVQRDGTRHCKQTMVIETKKKHT